MTDRPILFSGPMVRAILDGRKTQTRRPLSGVPEMPTPDCHPRHFPRHEAHYLDAYCSGRKTGANPRGMSNDWCWWQIDDRPGKTFRVPHAPGDRLWVRETWLPGYCHAPDHEDGPQVSVIYAADMREMQLTAPSYDMAESWGLRYSDDGEDPPKKRPSIHMPRWASRLTLIVTDVRVQRLRDIRPADILAEGATGYLDFSTTWDTLYGPGSWDSDPLVVATTFTAHHCNIDQMEAAE